MSDLVADLIRDRLKELDAERDELKQHLQRLVGAPTSSVAKKAARKRKPAARRAKPGEREEQILKDVRDNPGTIAADIAKRLEVQAPTIYNTLNKLSEEGKVTKKPDKTYVISESKPKEPSPKASEKKEEEKPKSVSPQSVPSIISAS